MSGFTGGGWGVPTPRKLVSRLLGAPRFTPDEVRSLLRTKSDDARALAVRRCLARPGDWLNPPPDVFTLPWRYQQYLPRVAFWYSRGEALFRIEKLLDANLSAWAVERCLIVACAQMAICLNRDPAGYGLAH